MNTSVRVILLSLLLIPVDAVCENYELSRNNVAIGYEQISPAELTVESGTTVVWQNNSDKAVRLKFSNKTISTMCKDARGFHLSPQGIAESNPIEIGEFITICFLKPDRYEYTVEEIGQEADSAASGYIEVSSR